MSRLVVFDEVGGKESEALTDHAEISGVLGEHGVRFEQWECGAELSSEPTQDEVIAAYKAQVDGLMESSGFQSVDVISLSPDHPDKDTLRQKFLSEHTHSDDEVRFFVDGEGLFYLHLDQAVYGVLCEKGDLISVPANTKHWFDMGPSPSFKCIRLFTSPDGWAANLTGNDISDRYPRHGE